MREVERANDFLALKHLCGKTLNKQMDTTDIAYTLCYPGNTGLMSDIVKSSLIK